MVRHWDEFLEQNEIIEVEKEFKLNLSIPPYNTDSQTSRKSK